MSTSFKSTMSSRSPRGGAWSGSFGAAAPSRPGPPIGSWPKPSKRRTGAPNRSFFALSLFLSRSLCKDPGSHFSLLSLPPLSLSLSLSRSPLCCWRGPVARCRLQLEGESSEGVAACFCSVIRERLSRMFLKEAVALPGVPREVYHAELRRLGALPLVPHAKTPELLSCWLQEAHARLLFICCLVSVLCYRMCSPIEARAFSS